MLKQFTLDEQFICDVTVRTEFDLIKDRNNPTYDDIVKVLKGHDKIITTENKDHDEFTKLREQLESQGYIKCERGWWNGDRVLKPFMFNDKKFKKHEKFPSACAMKGHLKYMK